MPPPALLGILCWVFSGQSLPQVQCGLPSCASPLGGDSPESQPRPLSLWQPCLSTPGGLVAQTWALSPLLLVSGPPLCGFCKGVGPAHPPPPRSTLDSPPHPAPSPFCAMETLSPRAESLSHLGETEVQVVGVGWRGDPPPGPGREQVPLGSAAPAGPCGRPGQAFSSGPEGLTSACSCWPWASRRTSCSSPRSRLSSASRRSRACVTGGVLLSRLGALTGGSAGC